MSLLITLDNDIRLCFNTNFQSKKYNFSKKLLMFY